jgi:hypothetical protein
MNRLLVALRRSIGGRVIGSIRLTGAVFGRSPCVRVEFEGN